MFEFIQTTDLTSLFPLGQIDIGLFFLQVLLLLSSIFLILLILVQRGKGGGLTGALGGMGGQSAFGSKAGDAFTKITVITALVWITLCMITIARYNPPPRAVKKAAPTATFSAGSQEETDAAQTGAASGDSESATEETTDSDSEESSDGEIKLDLPDLDAKSEISDDADSPEAEKSE